LAWTIPVLLNNPARQ
jgi:hypothetical protein